MLDAELLTMTVPPGSRLHSVSIFELKLPSPSVVTLIICDAATFVPGRGTLLRNNDKLLIVTTRRTRDRTERRVRAVRSTGPAGRWLTAPDGE